ncbi:hypothetical protein [Pontibacter chitinilyticus]|uniref:hypothetical protein n=1 Tax=Pontibacter chitinilyticus TaxID=2674989 RepID=UPI00321ABC41
MNKIVLNFGLLLLVSGCCNLNSPMKPTYNNGGYTFKKYKTKSLLAEDSVIISGKITDLNTNKPLVFSTLKLGCISQQTTSGGYKLNIRPFNVKSQLQAIPLGYLSVETEPFVSHSGDSIVIDFYVVKDESMIIDCN